REPIAPAASAGETESPTSRSGSSGSGTAAAGTTAHAAVSPSTTTLAGGSTCTLDNGLLRAVIDDQGYLVSMRDRTGVRELVPSVDHIVALDQFRFQS